MITAQEKEIICRLAQGQQLKEVAVNMNMHHTNVDYHIAKLKKRFGAKSLVQLVITLNEKGLLEEG